jgi:hypothetical protein
MKNNMEYKGKLYGKVNKSYFPLEQTADDFDEKDKAIKAIKDIANQMERWHLARDNDDETLKKINDILVDLDYCLFFNKNKLNK